MARRVMASRGGHYEDVGGVISANVSNHIKERREVRAEPQHSMVDQSECSG